MNDKKLWIVFYYDESAGENNFIWTVAKDYQEAEKAGLEQLKDDSGLDNISELDTKIIDCYVVEDAFDKEGNQYQVSLKKV